MPVSKFRNCSITSLSNSTLREKKSSRRLLNTSIEFLPLHFRLSRELVSRLRRSTRLNSSVEESAFPRFWSSLRALSEEKTSVFTSTETRLCASEVLSSPVTAPQASK